MATILVVEDTPDITQVMQLLLGDVGHTVITVHDGDECIAAAQQCQPDLILMDLALPRLDGWEATRQLKANQATCAIPVLAFTAYVQERELTAAREAGCEGIITKPFEIDDLLHTIEQSLSRAA